MQLSVSSLLVGLLPLVAAGPIPLVTRGASAGCTHSSFNDFSWTIEDFDYHASYVFSTPAHQNSWGYVSFNLSNPALPYKASCSASSDQLSEFFYGNQWFDCTLPGGNTNGAAQFEFNTANGQVNVNQTWECADQDPKYPVTFKGAGSANLTLDCTDTTWQNPNWTIGNIYSDREIKCKPVTAPLKPYEMTAVA